MMSAKGRDAEIAKLRDLFVGSIILAVDLPDKTVPDALGKFTVRKGTVKHEFHIHASDLGWRIGEHESSVTNPKGDEVRVYRDWSDMLSSIGDHLLIDEVSYSLDIDESALEPISDAPGKRVGFRCKFTGREWWVSLITTKQVEDEQVHTLFRTEEGRERLAKAVGVYGDMYRMGLEANTP